MINKKILLAGGAGYIGTHIYLKLLENNFDPIILDNFSNSNVDIIKKLEKITQKKVKYYNSDILDQANNKKIINDNEIKNIVVLAAKKSIEESIDDPLSYYYNNIGGLICLLDSINDTSCNNIVYSSSATVYGKPKLLPIKENHTKDFSNPYALSKIICEDVLESFALKNKNINFAILRYFNPAGSHSSGLIGEDSNNDPKNLFPNIELVLKKYKDALSIFGNDYDTKDGTCIRDFIHIDDLAQGHLLSINYLLRKKKNITLNLGSGTGYSILEIVNAFEKISQRKIKINYKDRRKGDIESVYSDIRLAKNKINWKPKKNLNDIVKSSLNSLKY